MKNLSEISTALFRALGVRLKLMKSPGYWHAEDLRKFASMVKDIEGDFAEIGVWRGDASRKLIDLSAAQNKRTHLFDSFSGMDDHGTFDSGSHPMGEFDVGGLGGFRDIMQRHGFSPDRYSAWDGFIPACFEKAPKDIRFSFVIIDVDNYIPTRHSLNWVWPLVTTGGIAALDDFYPSGDVDATKAIKEFIRDRDDYYFLDYFNHQLFLKKT